MIKLICLYVSFFLFIVLGCVSAQQTYVVPFLRKDGAISAKFTTMRILHLYKESEYSQFKGIPTTNPVYSVFSVLVNNFPEKKDKAKGIVEKANSISTIKQKIYIYVGLNEERAEKVVIVDCNHDLDFGDEKLYTFLLSRRLNYS